VCVCVVCLSVCDIGVCVWCVVCVYGVWCVVCLCVWCVYPFVLRDFL